MALGGAGRQLLGSPCPQVPPSIREDGRKANVSGMAGQSLTLECDANGFPVPEIVWLKDGQLVGVPPGWVGCGWDLGWGQAFWMGVPACATVGQGDVTDVFYPALGFRAVEDGGHVMKPGGGCVAESMAPFWPPATSRASVSSLLMLGVVAGSPLTGSLWPLLPRSLRWVATACWTGASPSTSPGSRRVILGSTPAGQRTKLGPPRGTSVSLCSVSEA